MSNYDVAFLNTIGHEGGHVNDPEDPGGETNFGITKRDHPHLDIANLSMDEAKEIYRLEYWQKMCLDGVKDNAVACEMFDTGVNMGTAKSIEIVQRSVNALGSKLMVDKYIGPLTVSEINRHSKTHLKILLKTMNCLQGAYYVTLTEKNPVLKKFFRGWIGQRVSV